MNRERTRGTTVSDNDQRNTAGRGKGSGRIAGTGDRQTILAYFSMRGVSFEDRCAAAAAAGFDGIGFNVAEYLKLRDEGVTDDQMRGTLAKHGVRMLELEALRLLDDDAARDFEHVARTFGSERVQVIAPFAGNIDIDLQVAADWIGALAKRTQDADIHYAIEFLPPTRIPDIATAQKVCKMSGHPNVGLCVDTWHVYRGAGHPSLADLDFSLVKNVQIDDGTLVPEMNEYIPDCIHNRRLLGEGEYPLVEFFRATPPTAPISIEIIADSLDSVPPFERAGLQARSLERILAAL
jgi:sugar phosphate isomerase/epimerase